MVSNFTFINFSRYSEIKEGRKPRGEKYETSGNLQGKTEKNVRARVLMPIKL